MSIWERLIRWLFGPQPTPQPEPQPEPSDTARTLLVPVEPRTAQVTIIPDGPPPMYGTTLLDGAHVVLPATVVGGAWMRVWAPGYRTLERRIVLPARHHTFDRVTLERIAAPVTHVPGCDGSRLIDPKAYFFHVIGKREGDPADDFEAVLLASGIPGGPMAGVKSDPTVHYGLTQQRGGDGFSGRVAGRVFLPTDEPQFDENNNRWFTRPVDILADRGAGPGTGLQWTWREWPGMPPYAPRPCRCQS